MTEQTQPQPEDLPLPESDDELEWDSDTPDSDTPDPEQPEPEHREPKDDGEPTQDEEILPPEDIGTNAQQVVSALLGHQRDLVAELHSVYQRLEEVRTVDYAALESRVTEAEAVVSAAATGSELQELLDLLDSVSSSLQEQQAKQTDAEQSLKDSAESHAAQLAERDARIAAQNARIEQLESAIVAAAESADSAHEKFESLAHEIESSLIHRVGERVSPAAQQARNALHNIRSRFRR